MNLQEHEKQVNGSTEDDQPSAESSSHNVSFAQPPPSREASRLTFAPASASEDNPTVDESGALRNKSIVKSGSRTRRLSAFISYQRAFPSAVIGDIKHESAKKGPLIALLRRNYSKKLFHNKWSHTTLAALAKMIGLYDRDSLISKLNEDLEALRYIDLNNPEGIFFDVLQGRETIVLEKLLREPHRIAEVDAVGATVIHMCYIFRKYDLGEQLVEAFPKYGLKPYADHSLYADIAPDDMPFAGENILHIAIVRKEKQRIAWLLDYYDDIEESHSIATHPLRELLEAKVTGTFFKDQEHYFGETPLHFAASTNDPEIFDLVLRYAVRMDSNALFARDSGGNTLLHIAVLRDLQRMYKHIKDKAAEEIREIVKEVMMDSSGKGTGDIEYVPGAKSLPLVFNRFRLKAGQKGYAYKVSDLPIPTSEDILNPTVWIEKQVKTKLQELMTLALNEDGHSPLTLAAKMGKTAMVEYIILEQGEHQFSYGPLTMKRLDVNGFEVAMDKHMYHKPIDHSLYSAVEWFCIEENTEAFSIPIVQNIIRAKWERIGRPAHIRGAFMCFAVATLVTLCLVAHVYSPEVHPYTSTLKYVNALYIFTAFFIAFRSGWDLMVVIRCFLHPSRLVEGIRGVAVLDKLCVNIISISFTAICFARGLTPSPSVGAGQDDLFVPNDYTLVIQYAMIICVLAAYTHIYYFLMGFEGVASRYILVLYKIVLGDVPFFFSFYFVILVPFGCAIALMTAEGSHSLSTSFAHFMQVTWTLVKVTVQIPDDFNINYVMDEIYWFYDFIRTSYDIAVLILMINLLIAMMSNTFSRYTSSSKSILLMEKYNILCAMQIIHSTEMKRNALSRYCVREKVLTYYDSSPLQRGDGVMKAIYKFLAYLYQTPIEETEDAENYTDRWYFKNGTYADSWFNRTADVPLHQQPLLDEIKKLKVDNDNLREGLSRMEASNQEMKAILLKFIEKLDLAQSPNFDL